MAEEVNDGGPAFPTEPNTQPGFYVHHGMSLRDYFAAQALLGMIPGSTAGTAEALPELMRTLSAISYQLADAMLAARAAHTTKAATE